MFIWIFQTDFRKNLIINNFGLKLGMKSNGSVALVSRCAQLRDNRSFFNEGMPYRENRLIFWEKIFFLIEFFFFIQFGKLKNHSLRNWQSFMIMTFPLSAESHRKPKIATGIFLLQVVRKVKHKIRRKIYKKPCID